jgi:hypothetical protein
MAFPTNLTAQETTGIVTWTSSEGKTIQAVFGGLSGENVTLIINGKPTLIPMARLALASRQQARKLAAEGSTTASTPAPASTPAATASAVPVAMPQDPSLPAEGAWKTGLKTQPRKQGVDRLFLINRGWIEGKLTGMDAASISFEKDGKTFRFPRAEISLLQLTDWMNPEKRQDKQEIKLRVVCEGTGQRAALSFGKGVIIKKVDAAPAFAEAGRDADDKAGTEPTAIYFDKGGNDDSPTKLSVDVTLLVPGTGPLECEFDAARSNGFAGPQTLHFQDPVSGAELVSFKGPIENAWGWFNVSLDKLKPGGKPYKVEITPTNTKGGKPITAVPMPPLPATPKEDSLARIILMNDQPVMVRVLSLEGDEFQVLSQATGKAAALPRSQVALIELNDWETALRAPKARPEGDPNLTPPLTFSLTGTSAAHSVEFTAGDTIAKLIAPPHYLTGSDRDDRAEMGSETSMEWSKMSMDQTPSQVEATAILSIKGAQGAVLGLHNHYTNVWSGYLEYTVYDTLSRKRVAGYDSKTWELTSELKIQRSKIFAP